MASLMTRTVQRHASCSMEQRHELYKMMSKHFNYDCNKNNTSCFTVIIIYCLAIIQRALYYVQIFACFSITLIDGHCLHSTNE